jgi:Na+-translocating ferredoxin:NAD+ oxidoreductase subunit B
MDPVLVKLALGGVALLGCIGLFFGIGLAMAAHKFHVEPDPKVEEVLHTLAGAQCGGCGFPGCEAYAEAVVHDPDVPPTLCFPGKKAVADAIAEITGKAGEAMEDMVAVVHCSRVQGNVGKKYNYVGYGTCSGANIAFAGPIACQYGCVGFGECKAACNFGAIEMVNDFPVIDPDKCVSCGACVKACPKRIIHLVPKSARVYIPCSTKDTAKETMAICKSGCIHDKACIRKCPAKAISEVNGVVTIDQKKCLDYGPSCEEVCISACSKVHILQPFSIAESHKKLAHEAA